MSEGDFGHTTQLITMSEVQAKVVRFHEAGDASVLGIEELTIPAPAPGEVRIKVGAIGLNRAEIMFRNNAYLEAPQISR